MLLLLLLFLLCFALFVFFFAGSAATTTTLCSSAETSFGPGKHTGRLLLHRIEELEQGKQEKGEASRAQAGHACNSATSLLVAATICNLFVALNQ